MPLIRTAGFKNFALMVENDALDFRLNIEAIRHARQAIDNLLQRFFADGGRLARARVFRLKNSSRFPELRLPVTFLFLDCFDIVEGDFSSHVKLGFKRRPMVFSKGSGLDLYTLC